MKLNNAQDAIKQAIEGGYVLDKDCEKWFWDAQHRYGTQWVVGLRENQILLDPLFWQALGKARGWITEKERSRCSHCTTEWKAQAIRWFETRLNAQDETKFWQNLP